MDYLTKEQVLEWAKDQPEDAVYCDYCLSRLVQDEDGMWYCPSLMCEYKEHGKLDDEEEPHVTLICSHCNQEVKLVDLTDIVECPNCETTVRKETCKMKEE